MTGRVLGEVETASFLAAFARTAAWSHATPVVGDQIVPPKVRVVLAGAAAVPLALVRPSTTYAELIASLPVEIVFGLLIGASARLILAGVESGGQLVGVQLGLGFAGSYDPMSREESLPTRRIAYALAALAFLAAGGLEESIRALALPIPGDLFAAPLLAVVHEGGRVLYVAARLAAPLLIAGIVANTAVAFASKAAPALNVFTVMLALFWLVGTGVLIACAPLTVREIQSLAILARDAASRIFG
jgi:flagellar biosynthetic protein FliR